MPHLIGQQQWVAGYGGADMRDASATFIASGFNWLVDLKSNTNPNGPDLLKIGMAQDGVFGAGLILGLARTNEDEQSGNETSTTYAGTTYGAFGSAALGEGNLFGSLYYSVNPNNNVTVKNTSETKSTNSLIHVDVNYAQFGSNQGDFSYSGGILADFGSGEPAVGDTVSSSSYELSGALGYLAASSEGQAVVLGVNGSLSYNGSESNGLRVLLSGDSSYVNKYSGMALSFRPHVAFQKSLPKGFEIFSGAGVTFDWMSGTDAPDGPDNDVSSSWLATNSGDVNVGLRWSHENFAIEGQVAEQLLLDGPDMIGGSAPGLFSQVGISYGF
jgi:hypothetical protein